MYIVIHDYRTPGGKIRLISCNLCKEVPVECFDENTLSATVFTQVQPAVDYIDHLWSNSKITADQHESMIQNIYDQLANYMVGRPYKIWAIEVTKE